MESILYLYDENLKQFIDKMKSNEFCLSDIMNSNTLRMKLSSAQVRQSVHDQSMISQFIHISFIHS